MSWNRSTFLGPILCVALGAALLARDSRTVVGGEGGAPQEVVATGPESIEAGDLWAHPGRYLGKEVRFKLRFKGWLADWNPFMTRFGPAEYRALSGWGEREFPWVRERFEAPRVRVFLRRGEAAEWALEDAQRYDSFEIVGRVRAAFAGEPWVDVTGVVPVLLTIPEGTVLHASRALGLIESGHFDRAGEDLERALAAPLPDVARTELQRLQQHCRDAAEAASDPLRRAEQRVREGTR